MKPRVKFLVGGAVILGVAVYLMASSIKTTGEYYLTPQELAAKVAADPSLRGSGVKMGARVIPGSIRRDPGGREVAFRVSDGDQTYPVVYRGIIPDMFTDSAECGRRRPIRIGRDVSCDHAVGEVCLALRECTRQVPHHAWLPPSIGSAQLRCRKAPTSRVSIEEWDT